MPGQETLHLRAQSDAEASFLTNFYSAMNNPIVIVGSYNQDLAWNCTNFPQPGETIFGSFATGPGGKGSNQAVAAARTGVGTTFVGAVGKDVFGEAVKVFYENEGLEYQLIEYDDIPTGNAGIFVSSSGENEIIVALGANLAFKSEDVREETLSRAEIVVCQNEIDLGTTCDVLRRARASGAVSVLNPAPMISDFRSDYLKDVDILIPNETEFAELIKALHSDTMAGFESSEIHDLPEDRLHELCQSTAVPTVILTLGSKGCFVSTQDGYKTIPGCSGIEVVDTTGAGDAFVGGFASGMVQFNKEIYKAASYANAVAALSVTKPGTAPSMPHKEKIDKFIN